MIIKCFINWNKPMWKRRVDPFCSFTIHNLLRQVINHRGEFDNTALAQQPTDQDERSVY
jgi:hypothetical protein